MTPRQSIALGVVFVLLGVLLGSLGIAMSYAIAGSAPAATLSLWVRFWASTVSLGGLLIAVVLTVLAVRLLLKGFRQ